MTPRSCRLALFAAVLAWAVVLILDPGLFRTYGIDHSGGWFTDLRVILSAGDYRASGGDPFVRNPLDALGRPHVYSSWWFLLHTVGLHQSACVPLGCLLALVGACALFGPLRPANLAEAGYYLLLLISPPLVIAFERGNSDLVIAAILALAVPCLVSARPGARAGAIAVIALAAGLKFYPAIAVVILLAGGGKEGRRRLLAGLLVLAAIAPFLYFDFLRVKGILPDPGGPMSFGANALWIQLGLDTHPLALSVGLAGLLALLGLRLKAAPPGDDPAALRFVLAALLLAGCYFAWTNFAYRWIFAIWLAPLLWQRARDAAASPRARRLARAGTVLLPVLLWGDSVARVALFSLRGVLPMGTLVAWMNEFLDGERIVHAGCFGVLLVIAVRWAWMRGVPARGGTCGNQ